MGEKETKKSSIMTVPFKSWKSRRRGALQILLTGELKFPFDMEQLMWEAMGKDNFQDFKNVMIGVEELANNLRGKEK